MSSRALPAATALVSLIASLTAAQASSAATEPDTTPPVIEFTSPIPDPEVWVADLAVTFAVTDDVSDPSDIDVRCEIGWTFVPCTQPVRYPDEWGSDPDGDFWLYATDEAGNEAQRHFSFKVDRDAPTGSFLGGMPEVTLDGQARLELLSGDGDGSGVDHASLSRTSEDLFGKRTGPVVESGWSTLPGGTLEQPTSVLDRRLPRGRLHCWSQTVVDRVGRTGPGVVRRCTATAANDRVLPLRAGWRHVVADKYYGRTATVSTERGARIFLEGVSASVLRLVATRGPGHGTVAVFHAGNLIKKVDLSAETSKHRRVITLVDDRRARTGRLELRVVKPRTKGVVIEGLVAHRRYRYGI